MIAAVIAAAASVGGILLNRRSTRVVEVGKWRRDVERELAGRALVHLREAQSAYGEAALELRAARATDADEARLKGVRTSAELRERGNSAASKADVIFAELQLVAGPDVLAVTESMSRDVERIIHHLRPGGGADDFYDRYVEHAKSLESSIAKFVDVVRKDLGIEQVRKLRR